MSIDIKVQPLEKTSSVRRVIVMTTINGPTEMFYAFKKYFIDWDMIVVGDSKTPDCEWAKLKNVIYLGLKQQDLMFPELSALIPQKCYARKNLGYLYAIQHCYDVIFDTDDDTIPYPESWLKPLQPLQLSTIIKPQFANTSKIWSNQHIWPRGYPLNHITAQGKIIPTIVEQGKNIPTTIEHGKTIPAIVLETKTTKKTTDITVAGINQEKKSSVNEENINSITNNVGVIQSMVDGDPDVDAIYRLTNQFSVDFRFSCGPGADHLFLLNKGVLCPFNSQNTYWINQQHFDLMYLPCTATFRACDIIRGYFAQIILWKRNSSLAFCGPTTVQKRNIHNLLHDFESELPIYLELDKILSCADSGGKTNDITTSYQELSKTNIINQNELKILTLWLQESKKKITK